MRKDRVGTLSDCVQIELFKRKSNRRRDKLVGINLSISQTVEPLKYIVYKTFVNN